MIVLGVLVMSGARCALFLKSLEVRPGRESDVGSNSLCEQEEGAAIYFYGTFVLHYAPLVLSVFAYTPRWCIVPAVPDSADDWQVEGRRPSDSDVGCGLGLWIVLHRTESSQGASE